MRVANVKRRVANVQGTVAKGRLIRELVVG